MAGEGEDFNQLAARAEIVDRVEWQVKGSGKSGSSHKKSGPYKPASRSGPSFIPRAPSTELRGEPMVLGSMEKKECSICHRKGHSTSECWYNKKESKGGSAGSVRSGRSTPTDKMASVKCHYCKNFGHYKGDCPDLKRKMRLGKGRS